MTTQISGLPRDKIEDFLTRHHTFEGELEATSEEDVHSQGNVSETKVEAEKVSYTNTRSKHLFLSGKDHHQVNF